MQFTNTLNVQKELPKLATRTSSQKVLNVLGPIIPELLGGSADLTGSNNTNWDGTVEIRSIIFQVTILSMA